MPSLGLTLCLFNFKKTSGFSSVWTPSELTSLLWIDASDSSTITSTGNTLIQINDKSGSNNSAIQSTPADRPETGINTLNDLNVITFNDNYLQLENNINNVKNILFVVNNVQGSVSFSDRAPIVSDGPVIDYDNYIFIQPNSLDDDYDISIDGVVGETGSACVNGNTLVSGTNIDLGLTNAEVESANIWRVKYDGTVSISEIAKYENRKLIGDVAEIILLGAETEDNIQLLEGYLAWKWNLVDKLPSNHPYKFDGSLFGYDTIIWTPEILATSLWLDASDDNTITETSGAISQWDDKSGNSNHAVQTLSANQPYYDLNNSRVQFSNINPSYFIIDNENFTNTDLEYFVVYKNTETISAPSVGSVLSNIPTGVISDGIALTTYNTYADSSYTIRHEGANITSVSYRVNGESTASYTGNTFEILHWSAVGIPVNTNDAYIGCFSDTVFTHKFELCEVIAIKNNIDEADRQIIEGYLAWKWNLVDNLSITHPYKTDGSLFGY